MKFKIRILKGERTEGRIKVGPHRTDVAVHIPFLVLKFSEDNWDKAKRFTATIIKKQLTAEKLRVVIKEKLLELKKIATQIEEYEETV